MRVSYRGDERSVGRDNEDVVRGGVKASAASVGLLLKKTLS